MDGGGQHLVGVLVEPADDGSVIGGGVGERCPGQALPGGRRQHSVLGELDEHRVVVGGVDDDADPGVVLRRSPDHRRAPDVDEADGGVGAEGVEVAHHEVDRLHALRLEIGHVLVVAGVGEDPGVDLGVEGLHQPPGHLREAGHLGDLGDVDVCLGERSRRPAARHQLPTEAGQPACQVFETGLVVDGQQGPHGSAPSISSRMVRG